MASFNVRTPLDPPPQLGEDWKSSRDEVSRWLNRLREVLVGRNDALRQGTRNALTVDSINPVKGKFFVQTFAGDAVFTDILYFDDSAAVFFPGNVNVAGNLIVTGSGSFGGPVQITNQCCFSVNRTAAQLINNATNTKIQLNVEQFDQGGYFDSSTNYRFTPLVAGKYLISGAVALDPSVAGTGMVVSIWKNGAIYRGSSVQASFAAVLSGTVTAVIDFNGTTDYVELYVNHNFGVATNTYASATGEGVYMTGHLIG